MRQHHAFGRAGAAAGIEDFGDFIFVEGENVGTRNPVARQHVFEEYVCLRDGLVDCDVAPDGRAGLAQFLNQRRKFTFENQHAGAGVIENAVSSAGCSRTFSGMAMARTSGGP